MFNRYRTAVMAEADAVSAATVPTPVAPSPVVQSASPVAATPPGEEWRNMTVEQFKQRLAESGDSAVKKALRDLGVDDLKVAKEAIAKSKQLEQEKLTETERLQNLLKDLEPKAKAADAYRAELEAQAKIDFDALPETMQKYVSEMAGEDALARARAIRAARSTGVLAAIAQQSAPVPLRAPAPATTMAGSGPAMADAASGVKTPWQQYDEIAKSGNRILAAQFRAQHSQAVEATKPK